jgi:phosphotransferase system enzyme I (PtsI)
MILTGKNVSPGIAVGKVYLYTSSFNKPIEKIISAQEAQEHVQRYLNVKQQALSELEEIRITLEENDPEKAKIFTAHKDIVDDIIINEEIPEKIINDNWAGDWAIYQIYETFLAIIQKAPDPLIAERSSDIEDVRRRLLRLWSQGCSQKQNHELSILNRPVIIAAHELLPSDTAVLNKNMVLAILTEKGGSTSHSAIIAKSYGIPAILGIHGLLSQIQHGQLAAIDAVQGIVTLNPDEFIIEEFQKKRDIFLHEKDIASTFQNKEARTADNVKIEIGLNIENDIEPDVYVDSAGLFRTEFLFMNRDTLPSEDEQFIIYKKVLKNFRQKPVILRTLDIGGDKNLSSMNLPKEENPFLGIRALRFCFNHPDIFKTQIRACLRASVFGNLWIMLPMVNSLEDIRRATEYIFNCKEELIERGETFGEIKTGIMIEVPSIALIAELAAEEVDFASIGSNDLCQYLCAADRMNSTVGSYYQSYHPGMFRLIKEIAVAFNNAGKPISICGELAADAIAVPVLIGLGLIKLSMGAASIAAVKRTIASFTIEKCEEIARIVLGLSTAEDVRKYLTRTVMV